MGCISGICYFDGRPVCPEALARLRESLQTADRLWTSAGLAMIEQGGSTAVRSGVRDLACHMEGRLDNRSELTALPSGGTDAELILALYEKSSWKQLGTLIGDWSLAVWNAADRSVCLASDYAGIRPLYFSWSRHRLVWSSSLAALSEWLGPCELDPDYVAEFLGRGASTGHTPYRGILAVPAGYALRFTDAGALRERLWQPPFDAETVYSAETDYEEQLRLLFRDAVKARLNDPVHVVAELSGGLDSSSVVCMARELIRSGQVAATGLTTLSYHDEPSSDDDFIGKVENACELPGRHLDLRHFGFASPQRVGRGSPAWWDPRHLEVARWMDEIGANTVLTGQLGDLVMGNWFDGAEQVAHDLGHRRFGSALRNAVNWGRTQRQPVYPILLQAMQSAMGRHPGPSRSFDPGETSLSIRTGNRAAELHLARITAGGSLLALPGRRVRLGGLIDQLQVRHMQSPESLRPVTCSHPFSHRPLVEFMMTIPPEIVYRPGEPRRLMRRAFADLLPKSVLQRRSKTGYNDVFRRSLVPMANQLLNSSVPLLLVEAGFVDADSLRRRLRSFVHGLACNETQLRHILLTELWLRTRTGVLDVQHAAGYLGQPDSERLAA